MFFMSDSTGPGPSTSTSGMNFEHEALLRYAAREHGWEFAGERTALEPRDRAGLHRRLLSWTKDGQRITVQLTAQRQWVAMAALHLGEHLVGGVYPGRVDKLNRTLELFR